MMRAPWGILLVTLALICQPCISAGVLGDSRPFPVQLKAVAKEKEPEHIALEEWTGRARRGVGQLLQPRKPDGWTGWFFEKLQVWAPRDSLQFEELQAYDSEELTGDLSVDGTRAKISYNHSSVVISGGSNSPAAPRGVRKTQGAEIRAVLDKDRASITISSVGGPPLSAVLFIYNQDLKLYAPVYVSAGVSSSSIKTGSDCVLVIIPLDSIKKMHALEGKVQVQSNSDLDSFLEKMGRAYWAPNGVWLAAKISGTGRVTGPSERSRQSGGRSTLAGCKNVDYATSNDDCDVPSNDARIPTASREGSVLHPDDQPPGGGSAERNEGDWVPLFSEPLYMPSVQEASEREKSRSIQSSSASQDPDVSQSNSSQDSSKDAPSSQGIHQEDSSGSSYRGDFSRESSLQEGPSQEDSFQVWSPEESASSTLHHQGQEELEDHPWFAEGKFTWDSRTGHRSGFKPRAQERRFVEIFFNSVTNGFLKDNAILRKHHSFGADLNGMFITNYPYCQPRSKVLTIDAFQTVESFKSSIGDCSETTHAIGVFWSAPSLRIVNHGPTELAVVIFVVDANGYLEHVRTEQPRLSSNSIRAVNLGVYSATEPPLDHFVFIVPLKIAEEITNSNPQKAPKNCDEWNQFMDNFYRSYNPGHKRVPIMVGRLAGQSYERMARTLNPPNQVAGGGSCCQGGTLIAQPLPPIPARQPTLRTQPSTLIGLGSRNLDNDPPRTPSSSHEQSSSSRSRADSTPTLFQLHKFAPSAQATTECPPARLSPRRTDQSSSPYLASRASSAEASTVQRSLASSADDSARPTRSRSVQPSVVDLTSDSSSSDDDASGRYDGNYQYFPVRGNAAKSGTPCSVSGNNSTSEERSSSIRNYFLPERSTPVGGSFLASKNLSSSQNTQDSEHSRSNSSVQSRSSLILGRRVYLSPNFRAASSAPAPLTGLSASHSPSTEPRLGAYRTETRSWMLPAGLQSPPATPPEKQAHQEAPAGRSSGSLANSRVRQMSRASSEFENSGESLKPAEGCEPPTLYPAERIDIDPDLAETMCAYEDAKNADWFSRNHGPAVGYFPRNSSFTSENVFGFGSLLHRGGIFEKIEHREALSQTDGPQTILLTPNMAVFFTEPKVDRKQETIEWMRNLLKSPPSFPNDPQDLAGLLNLHNGDGFGLLVDKLTGDLVVGSAKGCPMVLLGFRQNESGRIYVKSYLPGPGTHKLVTGAEHAELYAIAPYQSLWNISRMVGEITSLKGDQAMRMVAEILDKCAREFKSPSLYKDTCPEAQFPITIVFNIVDGRGRPLQRLGGSHRVPIQA